jgi:hypothetical protein
MSSSLFALEPKSESDSLRLFTEGREFLPIKGPNSSSWAFLRDLMDGKPRKPIWKRVNQI